MSTTTRDERDLDDEGGEKRYGNLRKPGWPGLFGTSPVVTAVCGTWLFSVLVLLWVRILLVPALIMWFIGAVVLAVMVWPSNKGPRYKRAFRRSAFKNAERSGRTKLVQGPAGRVPDGAFRLPGMAAQTNLTEHQTNFGDKFGLISWPKSHLHTVVVRCTPPGRAGRDSAVVDRLIANYGGFLASLSVESVAGASAVIETTPGSGARQRMAAERGRVADVPAFSVQALEDSLDDEDEWNPIVRAWFAITFDGRRYAGEKPRSLEEVVDDLSSQLPFMLGDIRSTGAGDTARWMTAQDLTDMARGMFDPAVVAAIESARLSGEGTGLSWNESGPAYHDQGYDWYQHDSALSRSWHMTLPPRGGQVSTFLEPLLKPHPDAQRKRVAILYRPQSPEESKQQAEQMVNSSTFGASQKNRVTSRHETDLQAAKKTEQDEANGAYLQRFGLVVTATAFSDDELERATRAIKGLSTRVNLSLRPAFGSQAVAFAVSMPIGMVTQREMGLPDIVRDAA